MIDENNIFAATDNKQILARLKYFVSYSLKVEHTATIARRCKQSGGWLLSLPYCPDLHAFGIRHQTETLYHLRSCPLLPIRRSTIFSFRAIPPIAMHRDPPPLSS